MNDSWKSSSAYENFMGRWSIPAAEKFLDWLNIPFLSTWLDVGCGTGAITGIIFEQHRPKEIIAVDSSEDFISYAKSKLDSPLIKFRVGLAESLEVDSNYADAAVSGLALNFIPQPEAAISEMIRVVKPGGRIGIFLWDYSEGMQMLRYFWTAASEISGEAKKLDEGNRFRLCREGELEKLFYKTGLKGIESRAIEIKTVFNNFNDYWLPFTGGAGPAPGYAMSLNEKDREKLKDRLKNSIPIKNDGSISMTAKAWAVKGIAE